jgi:hypothetical protein
MHSPPALSKEALETLRELRNTVSLPEPGHGWRDPEETWLRVVGQICAVGSSRSWLALSAPSVCRELSVSRIRAEGPGAPAYVHRILARLSIRYCSPAREASQKADAIATNAFSSFVADSEDRASLLNNLRSHVGEPGSEGTFTREQARMARRLLIRHLRFFGPKSASDFLLGLGLADSLIAFDVRLLNLLVDNLGWSPACRRHVSSLPRYTELEEEVARTIAEPVGMNLLTLDRVLFHHYGELRRRWGTGRPRNGQPHDPAAGGNHRATSQAPP